MELFQLVNPDKMSITCVGYAPSCGRRCRNPIAYRNVQAAKAVMKKVIGPGVKDADLKGMLYDLAEYTLCRRYHQGQATEVSARWFGMVQRNRDDEEDRGSDTSNDDDNNSDDEASSTSCSSTDSNDDDNNDNTEELRRRFDELETLQREFEELRQRQRQSLQDRVSRSNHNRQARQPQGNRQESCELRRSPTTHERRDHGEALRNAEQVRQEEAYRIAQRNKETAREQLRRDRAEQAKREEAQRQAQTQREAEAKAEAEAEAKARAEAEAENARLDRERQAKEEKERQSRLSSWETAWLRYEAAWAEISPNGAHIDTDIRSSQIWPTKSGSFASCCEDDVRAFFRCQPGDVSRRILRRQALRWHPDRAARLFASVADEVVVGELLRTVTMISQVVIGIMALAAQ